MKTSIIALSITALLTANAATASESVEEHINYGDPTASFSTVGLSGTDRAGQINMMYGAGSHIFQLDIGYDKKKDVKDERINVRARYFHVTDGLGYSVDVLGDSNNQTVLGGLIYKFQLTDNISIFPMLSVGATQNKIHEKKGDKYDRSALAQLGVYAMYGFDSGHWIYANPKTTYHANSQEFVNQIEVGGGFMLADNISVGAKIEYTADLKGQNGFVMPEDTVTWIQANYYF